MKTRILGLLATGCMTKKWHLRGVARSNSFDRGRSDNSDGSGRHAQAALGRATRGSGTCFATVLSCTLATLCIVAPLLARIPAGESDKSSEQKVRFAPVHVYLDPGGKPLAAYQFELKARTGRIKIVGVEGGAHPAFQEAPYYDPAALMNDRIIIAAFNTGHDLPTGRTRVATIHLQILGAADPQYELKLMAVADDNGQEIPAELNLQVGENK
jgi:hypothetical protein